MKMKKLSIVIFCLVLLAILVVIGVFAVNYINGENQQIQAKGIDYSAFTISIAEDHLKKTPTLGYAVVYGEKGASLELMTAAHIFDGKKDKYTAMFHNGTCLEVKNIRVPIDGLDLAFFEVDRQDLQNGKDYSVPRFSRYNADKTALELYVFMDELYYPPERKILEWKTDENNVSQLFFPGKIAKGRSGSPVFLKDTDTCIGIVSGYMFAKGNEGEKTLAFLLY